MQAIETLETVAKKRPRVTAEMEDVKVCPEIVADPEKGEVAEMVMIDQWVSEGIDEILHQTRTRQVQQLRKLKLGHQKLLWQHLEMDHSCVVIEVSFHWIIDLMLCNIQSSIILQC
jgi:hypothetical protein